MSNYLEIYGASDDLVEFDGAFVDEFNVYSAATFKVEIRYGTEESTGNDCDIATFEVTAEYDREWELSIKAISGSSNIEVAFRFGQRPDYDSDPTLIIDLDEGADVSVTML